MAWTDGVDRATGYKVTAVNWNALLGATGSLMGLKTREVWSPVTHCNDGAADIPMGQIGAWLAALNANASVLLRVPDDYGSIVEAVLVVRPRATQAAANWDILLQKFPIGGADSSQSDAATTYNVTDVIPFEVAFTALWTALAPGVGDVVRFQLAEQTAGHDVQVLGAFIRYNPPAA